MEIMKELCLSSVLFWQVFQVLKVMENCADALSVRGSLELKADDWLKAKETYKSIQVADGKDSYSTLALVTVSEATTKFLFLLSHNGLTDEL